MKTFWQIMAAHDRARMRNHAMEFRAAIAPDVWMNFNTRCDLGCRAIEAAVRMRKQAEGSLLFHARAQRQREALLREIAWVEEMLAITPDDPFAKPMLQQRLEELKAEK